MSEKNNKSNNPYERAKAGRLAFKDGTLATRKSTITKKKKSKKTKSKTLTDDPDAAAEAAAAASSGEGGGEEPQAGGGGGGDIYTIDAAKKMKYEELFPVETKKFGYDPNFKAKSVEDALDERVKKKADRYCK